MMIPVKFLNFNKESPNKGYWDMFLLEKIFADDRFTLVDEPSDAEPEMIVVIPARHNYDKIPQINSYLKALTSVLLIIAGDEESLFELDKIKHPNMRLYLMTPSGGKFYPRVDRFIGEGPTPHTELMKYTPAPTKDLNWFFSGQVTHSRRFECISRLREMKGGVLNETDGFTKGLAPLEYIETMSRAKIIPCPSGPTTPDTFRFYEALEMGCIPIVDAYTPENRSEGYWETIFGDDIPFPIIRDWEELPGLTQYFCDVFPIKSNEIFAWWQLYKRNLKNSIINDFYLVSGQKMMRDLNEEITVVIPTSPTQSNPDTSVIEETISSIRAHLPTSEIIITFDGIREEQESLRENYEEYKRQVLWKCNHHWNDIVPIIYSEHEHQVGMLRGILKYINTKKILYIEHDAPLTPDVSIDWASVSEMLDSGTADLVRFHFESRIPEEHQYLMLEEKPVELFGQNYMPTIQWSQRPHLATVDFYRRILDEHFSVDALTFIEDKMHGVVIQAYKREQKQGWNKFKLWIYHPTDGNIKRSYHLDGRGKEQKYEMKF